MLETLARTYLRGWYAIEGFALSEAAMYAYIRGTYPTGGRGNGIIGGGRSTLRLLVNWFPYDTFNIPAIAAGAAFVW
jgi:hypothetical protein